GDKRPSMRAAAAPRRRTVGEAKHIRAVAIEKPRLPGKDLPRRAACRLDRRRRVGRVRHHEGAADCGHDKIEGAGGAARNHMMPVAAKLLIKQGDIARGRIMPRHLIAKRRFKRRIGIVRGDMGERLVLGDLRQVKFRHQTISVAAKPRPMVSESWYRVRVSGGTSASAAPKSALNSAAE